MISGIVHLVSDLILASLVVGCILAMTSIRLWAFYASKVYTCLGCNHELVSNASFLGPLAYEFFGGFVLAGVECELISYKVEPRCSKAY